MSAKTNPLPAPWVPANVAAELTMRSVRSIRGMARRGLVRTFETEGLRPLYFRADLEKLAPPELAATVAR